MDKEKIKKEIGNRLRTQRKQLGLTQAQLSEQIGLQVKSYANVESGRTRVSIEVLMKLADALGASTDFILFGYNRDSATPLDHLLQSMEPQDLENIEKIMDLYKEIKKKKNL